tara:strand:+ start:810 stop:1091 length:282 start_codon:yes stop_codon:yes gene_type:complete
MSKLFYCDKNKVVWEQTEENKSLPVYKRDKDGNILEDKTGKYAVEIDENGEMKRKLYKKTIHIYKGFPSYKLERKNIPSNEDDKYFVNSSMTD